MMTVGDPAEAWGQGFDSMEDAINAGFLTTPEEVTAYALSMRYGLAARTGWVPPRAVSEAIVADIEDKASVQLWTPGSD